MLISLNWLKRLSDLPDVDTKELCNKITMSIAEVDGFHETYPYLNDIYSAKILEINKIPETDHLQVTKIDTGEEIIQVVCGANNIEVGDIVPLAKIGAELPLEEGKTLKIKKGTLKGFESSGMLCSARELKLSTDHSGILKLDKNTKLNTPLSKIINKTDLLIEIDNKSITHRPDLWGHLGFAREISALLKGTLKPLYFKDSLNEEIKKEHNLSVTIENADACRRYNGLVVSNVKVEQSPEWMQQYLMSVGLNPINNIVDITNFVMTEIGQPMHAFDLTKLNSADIFVRFAKEGEKITALNGEEYNLLDSHLVIADKLKPIAIAGVIGGDETKIDENTTTIVLESANFHAATVRRCANKLAVRTDSSNRFEKSQDPENTLNGIKLAYYLIKQLCPNAYISSELVDNYPTKFDEIFIEMAYDEISDKLGVKIDDSQIKNILTSLYFEFIKDENRVFTLKVPSFRATKDVNIKADIVEEIGRIYGYDNIPDKPFLTEAIPPKYNRERVFERDLKNKFANRYGFSEVYNYTFVSEDDIVKFNENPENYLGLKNALSSDYTKIRRHLFISAIKSAVVNLKNETNGKFFEVGRGYILENKTKDNLATEVRFLTATQFCENAEKSKEAFYNLKNVAFDYFETAGLSGISFVVPQTIPEISHPLRIGEFARGREVFGKIIELNPKLLQKFDVTSRIVCLELNLSAIFAVKKSQAKFTELPKYPYSSFEATVVVDKKVFVQNILEVAKKAAKKLFKDVELITIFEGSQLPEGKKAVSFEITLGVDDRTLNSTEIDSAFNEIIASLEKNGYPLRGR